MGQGECRGVGPHVVPSQEVDVDGTVGVVAAVAFLRAAKQAFDLAAAGKSLGQRQAAGEAGGTVEEAVV